MSSEHIILLFTLFVAEVLFLIVDSIKNPNNILKSSNVTVFRMLCHVSHLSCSLLARCFYKTQLCWVYTCYTVTNCLCLPTLSSFLAWVGHPNLLTSLSSPLYPTLQERKEAFLSLFMQQLACRNRVNINNNNNSLHLSVDYIPGPMLA